MPAYIHHHGVETVAIVCPSCIGLPYVRKRRRPRQKTPFATVLPFGKLHHTVHVL
jgi:hypothetical protein